MSFTYKLAFYSAFGIASVGPIPIISGGTPETAKEIHLANLVSPKRFAAYSVANKTKAAPSVT